jgi:hypothetical protein
MKPINLNQIPTEYILKTKAGKLWRCGKGYRKNWTKLIGKLVLLHNTPYTLINRIKEAGKWYLIFTDGNNNYTERQDKALHNKKLAKDTIIEVAKRVIAGLLPAPKELVDILYDEVIRATIEYNKHNRRKMVTQVTENVLTHKLRFIAHHSYVISKPLYHRCKRQILQYYHPDHNSSTTTDFMELLYWIFNRK